MRNQLQEKSIYTIHRELAGSPVTADSADLKSLFETPNGDKRAISCLGWKQLRGFVIMEGGTTPTVSLVPLEHVTAENAFPGATNLNEGFIVVGLATGALLSAASFTVTIRGGRLFLRVDAVTGSPTKIRIYLAGEERLYPLLGE